jgi:flagellar hook protein FlgE
MSSFSIALSGLTASSTDLTITSNNIANADTVGFKGSDAAFADVYAVAGEGVRIASTEQDFTQGDISTSDSNLNLAISGNGFFTLQSANGTVYSRNGQFTQDSSGNVVSSTGAALQVYPPLANGGFNTGALTDLNLNTAQSAPLATTTGTAILNLQAGAQVPTVTTFDPTNSASYNQSTSTTVYDSLGESYPATFYFVQTATPNTVDVYMTVNGTPVNATDAAPNGVPQTLTFSNSGAVTSPTTGVLNFSGFTPPDGAAAMSMAFTFNQSTQYGGSFGVTSLTQNGYATGQLSTVSIDSSGVVSAVYTNGRSTVLGQVAMANFPNPQGLQQLGDTDWAQTFASGSAVQGTASSSGFGSIQSGALESSNVDLTTELVNMITAQRAFDSNAQVITTANQESQTLIQISH